MDIITFNVAKFHEVARTQYLGSNGSGVCRWLVNGSCSSVLVVVWGQGVPCSNTHVGHGGERPGSQYPVPAQRWPNIHTTASPQPNELIRQHTLPYIILRTLCTVHIISVWSSHIMSYICHRRLCMCAQKFATKEVCHQFCFMVGHEVRISLLTRSNQI